MTQSNESDSLDQPAAPAEESPEPVSHHHGLMHKLIAGVRRPIPGAQPRIRFSFPPEAEADFADEAASVAAVPARYAMSPIQNPIYLGFMGTVGVGLALFLFAMITNTQQLLLWIVAALFIALGLDPVVRGLERRKVPRPAGILLVLLVLVSMLAAFFATLIPTLVQQTSQLVEKAPVWISDFLNSDFFKNLDSQYHVIDRINEEVAKFFANSQAVGGIFGGVIGISSTIANGLFGTLIVLVLSLYFLASLPAIKNWSYRLAPRSRRARVESLSEEITQSVGNYVIGQVCVAVLNATFAFIVMSILHIPFSVLLAFVVALLAFIPLVGGMIAAILVIAVSFTAGWQTAVAYAILYFAYLQFEAYFVSPRIMQKAVAVPGAMAVISVIAGGSLLGVLGALIAIPTAAAVMLLIKEVFITRQDKH
ncbi:AI-2E family transporter [Pseudarthrobacter sp. P1]|uniref:AI-2E family transporter n=1 Tax=Pseudarthrobacter sp. P1 TaxID=3418418 RepID=UPI003CF040E9